MRAGCKPRPNGGMPEQIHVLTACLRLYVQPHGPEVAAPQGEVGGGVHLAADGGAGVCERAGCFMGGGGCGRDGHGVNLAAAHVEPPDGFHWRSGVVKHRVERRGVVAE